jgi:eukaryotic-like serine/threonine-protein kinase
VGLPSRLIPQVIGRYALYGEIAAGGMATVHYGRLVGPVGFSRTVAIKRLHAQFAKDPEFAAMFLDEARLAARIRHPNVVQTLDVVASDGELFLVMEYVHGESLVRLIRACVAKGETVPLDLVSGIVCGALHGLHSAHEAKDEHGEPLGIVHRDVSPQNVLVGADGVPRVLDFGVAKAAGRVQTTREGQLKGKLSYMSPEQLRSEPIDRRTDVYAMGVVLWELLTLERLFFGEGDGAIMRKVLDGARRTPSSVAAHVPSSVDAVALQALDRNPAERFQTAREMARALEAAVPMASATRISDWLEGLVGDVLARRAKSVEEIESQSGTGPTSMAALDETAEPTLLQRSSEKSSPRGSAGRMIVSLVAVAVLAVVVLVVARMRSSGERSGSASEAGPSMSAPVTLTDLPLPTTTHPEALDSYRQAVQALRDGNLMAEPRLSEAIKVDPSMAAAQLRLALRLILVTPAEARVHYAQAQQVRDSLSEHDRVLLDAVEPYIQRDPADMPEYERRLRAAHDRFPLDLDFAFGLVVVRDGYASKEEQLGAIDRIIAMDPKFGYAYFIRAYYQAYAGDFEGVRRTTESCIRAVPSADRCLLWLTDVEEQTGPPERLEADARRLLATAPAAGNHTLAEAMFAEGRPIATVLEALDQHARLNPAVGGNEDGRYTLAVLTGDFTSAEQRAVELLSAVKDDPSRSPHAKATRRLVELYQEEGETSSAAGLASGYLERKDAWAPDPRGEDYAMSRDPTPYMVSVVVHAGKAPPEGLVTARQAWLEVWKRVARPMYAPFLWPHAYASTVESPDEAREAVAAMGPYEPVPPFWPITFLGGDIGRTLLLAGRKEDGLKWIREAANSCEALDFPIEHTRAIYWLGQALEQTGDREGACRAYRRVLDRWGNAKPRSVTATRARERAKALACP